MENATVCFASKAGLGVLSTNSCLI